ncbi:phenylalanine--tRNA ligase subunit beta [bacterium]|nr:phenylalanine--tRNA ligase subunit beta [bacterium]NCQ54873.1 phenylalanine--tRNA ligase subunit beta [Candidatus Parcubacteria bacterium]NCS66917.1 phenylalanine--tRNA ligase subunit beta [Candidatus Peregrinibacteria bacterium]NCS95863.1 phenylalanine--tRNA ligase subunit beta [bacterium]
MKISWQWLQDFVTINESAEVVGEKLTLHTAELEETIKVADSFAGVFVGKLISHVKIADSDKLHIGQFDVGAQGQKQIVFGSVHPLADGEIVPVALDGARLGSGIEIKNSEIQGHKSEGMVCDNRELGLKNETLLRISDESLVGKPLSEAVESLSDTLFDIDNKSLTHRPDLMGHRGFARELATIYGVNLRLPEPVVSLPEVAPFQVEIQTDGCRRFCALPIEGVRVTANDPSKTFRLEQLGTKSLSNIVDITNWIMLEFGQPMHVFDADKIEGSIVVRLAKEGEKLVALDGNEYELTAEDMVVADSVKPLSIAGIMGGLASSVSSSTTNILFEAANWDPVMVRKTAQRHGIRTESSMRYEKSLAPEKCQRALLAAAEMALDYCPKAKITAGLTDIFPQPQTRLKLELDPSRVSQIAGVDISPKFMEDKLYRLGFKVDSSKTPWHIEVPFFRSTKDVSIAEDIIEEVIRMYGFENIPSTLPTLPVQPPVENKLRTLEWKTRDFWSANGFLELMNYSFVKGEDQALTGETEYTEIENPLSDEYQFLRRSLVSNTLKHLESELRTQGELAFYELGRTYHPAGNVLPTEKSELLLLRASLVAKSENQQFYNLKSELTLWLESLGLSNIETRPAQNVKPYQHPAKTAEILVNGKLIGTICVLHPLFLPHKPATIALAELDMAVIEAELNTHTEAYEKLSSFPSVHRDVSLVMPEKVLMGEVVKTAQNAAKFLESIDLFDEYRDPNKLGADLKNLAFHLSFRSKDQTLTDDLIEADFKSITDALKSGLKAQLRLEFDNAKLHPGGHSLEQSLIHLDN